MARVRIDQDSVLFTAIYNMDDPDAIRHDIYTRETFSIPDSLWQRYEQATKSLAEIIFEIKKRKTEGPRQFDNPCIHTPSRCNGGGYDGCACGPYPT